MRFRLFVCQTNPATGLISGGKEMGKNYLRLALFMLKSSISVFCTLNYSVWQTLVWLIGAREFETGKTSTSEDSHHYQCPTHGRIITIISICQSTTTTQTSTSLWRLALFWQLSLLSRTFLTSSLRAAEATFMVRFGLFKTRPAQIPPQINEHSSNKVIFNKDRILI